MGEESKTITDLGDAEAGPLSPLDNIELNMIERGLRLSDVDRQFLRDNPDVAEALCDGMLEIGPEGISQAVEEIRNKEKKMRFTCAEVIGDAFSQPLPEGLPPIPPHVLDAKRIRDETFAAHVNTLNARDN